MVFTLNLLDQIQTENAEWAERNFPGKCDNNTAFMGMVEELGELSHVRLKTYQGIRQVDPELERDAIGDLLIYMLHYCTTKDWKLSDILIETWTTVKCRDWIAFPKDGVSE